MRVGLPRALLYYRYGRFWQAYLSALGLEVVVSRMTDRRLVETGVGLVPSEVCLPIKIAIGHVVDLIDRVDAIFLPRLVWLQDKLYACPKMIGIADLARMVLGERVRLIAPTIAGDFTAAHIAAGTALTRAPIRAVRAFYRARAMLAKEQTLPDLPAGERRVALIGHFYNTGDDYVARPVVDTLRRLGNRVITKDELPAGIVANASGFAGCIRWVYERELYNAFRFLVGRVDGICVMVSMGCGPDSLIAEFMREEAASAGVPFMQLVLDEHTGTAGIVTRIEAFAELARRHAA